MSEYSILLVRNEQAPMHRVESALSEGFGANIDWMRVEALFDGLRVLQERTFHLIISDLFLADSQGLETVRDLHQHAPGTPVIVFCHAKDRGVALHAVRKGAHDFFCYEDMNPANLRKSVTSALASERLGAKPKGAERRNSARFPCRLAVSYQSLEPPFITGQATSETVNISSKGLLFTTPDPLQPGQLFQVSVDWPARLENEIPLKLVAEGRIIRNVNGQAAMAIDKYEFRTRRVHS